MPPVRIVRPNGAEIRERRMAAGITLEGLARATGRHYQTIAKIEGGKLTRVSIAIVNLIAHVLPDTRPADIIAADEPAAADADVPEPVRRAS